MGLLIMGIGNVLLMDEGIGVHAIEELGRRYVFSDDAELLDGGTSGIELLRYIQENEDIIIIDAIRSGHPPGTVLRVEGEDVPALFHTRISPHQIGLSDLLAASMLSGCTPRHLVLFGIEPKLMDTGLELSCEVKSQFSRLMDVITAEVKSMGYSVELRGPGEMQCETFWGRNLNTARLP